MIDWKRIFENSNFWGVKFAKQAIDRAKKKGKKFVSLRCANTPTGILHIGNANDIIRNYFIALSIKVLGFESEVIFTSDDRDPIRGFPPFIVDRNGNIIKFEKREEWERKYDGQPVALIPDPLNCHSSWSEHFLSVYFKEFEEMGIFDTINFKYVSPNINYFQGKYNELVKKVLENKEKVKEIYSKFKEHIREYPLSIICENCGRIGTTHVTDYNPKTGKVKYICGSRHLKKKTVEGCGYEGETFIKNGKLDWYIEWALNWAYFDTDLEPMGKDHWVSSWKISPLFAREIFGIEPPIPVPYEFFLVNGEKMSGSKGNLFNLTELLKMLEPEIIFYLYSKRPMTQRNIDMKNIHLLVYEFDRLEEKTLRTLELLEKGEIDYNDLKDPKKIKEKNLADIDELVAYYLCMRGKIEKNVRIPYLYAAIIGQTIREEDLPSKLVELGLVSNDLSMLEKVIKRIKRATYWVRKYGPEKFRIKIIEEKINIKLSEKEKEVIKEIISFLEENKNLDPNFIQTQIHSLIKNKLDPKQFYKKLYQMILGREEGPRIGNLISVEKEKIVNLLKKYL